MYIIWIIGPIIVLSKYAVSMFEIEVEFALILDETYIHIKFRIKNVSCTAV